MLLQVRLYVTLQRYFYTVITISSLLEGAPKVPWQMAYIKRIYKEVPVVLPVVLPGLIVAAKEDCLEVFMNMPIKQATASLIIF